MKKLLSAVMAVCALSAPAVTAAATYDGETDYMEIMMQCAETGDWVNGQQAQFGRDAKIDAEGLDKVKISFEDLYLLAKIMYSEAGSAWLSDEWKMCVGEVVLNRVASPEFPDTIAEVIFQPGQYCGADSERFAAMNPDRRCLELALRLLEGERVMDRPSVVFQANFRQGSGVHRSYHDEYLGWTYFCDSSRPQLYET